MSKHPVPPEPSTPGMPRDLPERFGQYRILQKLGEGGMGAVYRAHDTKLDRPVALKVPHFPRGSGPEVLQRFLREARRNNSTSPRSGERGYDCRSRVRQNAGELRRQNHSADPLTISPPTRILRVSFTIFSEPILQ
jgi:serine/threonine protein kinase